MAKDKSVGEYCDFIGNGTTIDAMEHGFGLPPERIRASLKILAGLKMVKLEGVCVSWVAKGPWRANAR